MSLFVRLFRNGKYSYEFIVAGVVMKSAFIKDKAGIKIAVNEVVFNCCQLSRYFNWLLMHKYFLKVFVLFLIRVYEYVGNDGKVSAAAFKAGECYGSK